jgi:xanthine phosphoribosyltransferase
MQLLEERIQREAKHLGNGVLKVDSFMNHQIDPMLMQSIGEEFAIRFAQTKPTRILTAETSGIAPALAAGMALKIPIVFARKHAPITMAENPFRETSVSPTHRKEVELLVSSEYLAATDRVLIIDDFLATAKTLRALILLVAQSGATLVGIGAVIEKVYVNGRSLLSDVKVPIESLAAIERCEGDRIILSKPTKTAATM